MRRKRKPSITLRQARLSGQGGGPTLNLAAPNLSHLLSATMLFSNTIKNSLGRRSDFPKTVDSQAIQRICQGRRFKTVGKGLNHAAARFRLQGGHSVHRLDQVYQPNGTSIVYSLRSTHLIISTRRPSLTNPSDQLRFHCPRRKRRRYHIVGSGRDLLRPTWRAR